MSVLTEYFASASDDAASAVLLRPSGPAGPPRSAPVRTGLLRRLGRTAGQRSPASDGAVVDGAGIEPVLQMLLLESILTGRSEEDIDDDRSGEEFIAGDEVDGPSVVKLSAELTAALRRARSHELAEASTAWAAADEFGGATRPETLAAFLRELAELARWAAKNDAALYCWVSP